MNPKNFEKNLEQIKFHNCQDEEALKLKQEIDEEACNNDDIAELLTAFLEMRTFSFLENCREKPNTVTLVELFLNSLGEPYNRYMVEDPHIERWQKLDKDEVRIRFISLLTGGVSGLTQVFYPPSVAEDFVDRLLLWIGSPTIFLANMFRKITPLDQYPKSGPYTVSSGSGYDLFHFPCSSDGIIFISENKIGILWCFGCD